MSSPVVCPAPPLVPPRYASPLPYPTLIPFRPVCRLSFMSLPVRRPCSSSDLPHPSLAPPQLPLVPRCPAPSRLGPAGLPLVLPRHSAHLTVCSAPLLLLRHPSTSPLPAQHSSCPVLLATRPAPPLPDPVPPFPSRRLIALRRRYVRPSLKTKDQLTVSVAVTAPVQHGQEV